MKKINRKGAHKLPRRIIVDIEKREEYDRVDLIDGSLFLVSDAVKNVFSLYDDDIFFKTVVLMTEDGNMQMKYNLPIFEEPECLCAACESDGYGALQKPVVARQKVKGKSIFKILYPNKRYIVVRLDVAESLLRRKLKGLSFTEIEAR
jgi:hypothetical protein